MVQHTQIIRRSCNFNNVVNPDIKLYKVKLLLLAALLRVWGTFSGNVFFKEQFFLKKSNQVSVFGSSYFFLQDFKGFYEKNWTYMKWFWSPSFSSLILTNCFHAEIKSIESENYILKEIYKKLCILVKFEFFYQNKLYIANIVWVGQSLGFK